jgi:hypothetical protein
MQRRAVLPGGTAPGSPGGRGDPLPQRQQP